MEKLLKIKTRRYAAGASQYKRYTRSRVGNAFYFAFLLAAGAFSILPMIYCICTSFKPLDELYVFPPRFFVRNPTVGNFRALANLLGESQVPMIRYIFNTVFVTTVATGLHLLIASLAAFTLEKRKFPGRQLLFRMVVLALMFSTAITSIPNYIIMERLGWIDTYWSIIIPAFAAPIGLFLMKQFMEGLPTSLIEAAKIDGANEWKVFISIVMPNVKPAWMTLIIFSVQSLWNNPAATYIYSEEKKTLVYAMRQIQSGGIARTGQGAAVLVVLMIVPIVIFVFSESQILETMASSGLKD